MRVRNCNTKLVISASYQVHKQIIKLALDRTYNVLPKCLQYDSSSFMNGPKNVHASVSRLEAVSSSNRVKLSVHLVQKPLLNSPSPSAVNLSPFGLVVLNFQTSAN